MERLEAAHELQYYCAMEKKHRKWEACLLSRLEATPVPRLDFKLECGSLSVHEREALLKELTEEKDQLEDALRQQLAKAS